MIYQERVQCSLIKITLHINCKQTLMGMNGEK